MQRVEADGFWSLFDPKDVPLLPDLFGDAFTEAYEKAEAEKLYHRQIKARDLYARMMRSLAETGNGWMTFKDATNLKCNQTGKEGNVVHLSNLCTEITEVTSKDQTAVCNLGSINLARHITVDSEGRPAFDFEKLGATVRTAVPMLDRVIDINYYPIAQAASSNAQWRPIGLGLAGLQDYFLQLHLPVRQCGSHGALDENSGRDLFSRLTASPTSPRKMARTRVSTTHVLPKEIFNSISGTCSLRTLLVGTIYANGSGRLGCGIRS